MHKRPLAVISVFFIVGIVLGRFMPDTVTLSHVFVGTLIFIALTLIFTLTLTLSHLWERGLFWVRSRGGFETRPYDSENGTRSSLIARFRVLLHIFLFLSITSLGTLLYLNSNIFPSKHISHFLGKDKVKAEIIGIIKSPAEARGVYYGKVRSRYIFEIETMRLQSDKVTRSQRHKPVPSAVEGDTKTQENPWIDIHGLALVRIQTEKDYQYGDRLMVKGTIKRPGLPNDASRLHSKNMASPDDASRLRPLAAFARRILMFERSREPILIIKHI